MKVLITGSRGFIGKNLVENLKRRPDIEIYQYNSDSTDEELEKYCRDCDFVVNLAGVNRSTDKDKFVNGNLGVTEKVVQFLKKHGNKAPILLSSSIQADNNTDYGISKKLAEDFLLDYHEHEGTDVLIYRFPNVFGKWGKPNYNSVVATFCYNISRDLPIVINNRDADVKFVYIDDVVQEITNAIDGHPNQVGQFYEVQETYDRKVGEVADLIQSFKDSRTNLNVVDAKDAFAKKLYSTYLSYLSANAFDYALAMHSDDRGSFLEILKFDSAGQISVNIAKPNITKGNHWHNTKNEKFIVLKGKGVIRFRRPFEKEVYEYDVSGENLKVVDIPCGYIHNITNVGEEDLIFMIWANEVFDPNNPDTYYEEV